MRILFPLAIIMFTTITWDAVDSDPNEIRRILEAAARASGEVPFNLNIVLEGVSPNASSPTPYDHDLHVGPRSQMTVARRIVTLPVTVEWTFASGNILPQMGNDVGRYSDWRIADAYIDAAIAFSLSSAALCPMLE
jgi:hypothetical protein